MLEAAALGVAAFAVSFGLLLGVERLIHRLTHNPDRSYRWGVWLFALLAGAWIFITSLGR